jgi:hypothetical protein
MLFQFGNKQLFCLLGLFAIVLYIVVVILTIQYTTQENVVNLLGSYLLYRGAWKNDDEIYSNIKNASCNVIDTRLRTILSVRMNYSLSGHSLPQTDIHFLGVNRSLETTVECIGDLYNQSCLYKNLYYVDSTFWVLTIKGRNLPSLAVRIGAFEIWDFFPSMCEFGSHEQLHRFIRSSADPKVISGVTLYFAQPWHFNIGHALFDGLYPAYVALIRFKSRHLRPFRLLLGIDECKDCWSEDVYARFAGLGIIKQNVLNRMSAGKWFVFDELVMGSGMMCQRCVQPNLQLPGSIELNGGRLFRDRMYVQHSLIPPVARHKQSTENRESRDVLNAFIIDNKRFTFADRKEIKAAINEINKYTTWHLKDSRLNVSKLEWPLIRVFYVYYGDVKAHNHRTQQLYTLQEDVGVPTYEYELAENNFMAQLRLLRKIDIHVTGPGTGQMYQPLLSDGSVSINLGGLRPTGQETTKIAFASFLEQYMTGGTSYIKGLYYPINERPKGIQKDEVVKLIRNAGKLILEGFSIPVNPKDNLAVDGQLFIDMCKNDHGFCKLVTTRSPKTIFDCIDIWVEDMIHEQRQWKAGGFSFNGKTVSCPFNRTLLHELRQKYNIHHYES